MELDGILVVNKHPGPTSHDVVSRVGKRLAVKKAGHLGTLDPLAEGVLVICLGNATKIAQFLSGADKEYEAAIVLGVETDTWDAEGKVVAECDPSEITREKVEEALRGMRGDIELEAPLFSAIKQGGEALYRKARRGEKVEGPIRHSKISKLEMFEYRHPRFSIRCEVSSGTYIRSIASEAGRRLGVGAHIEKLRRIRSGGFMLKDAIGLDDIDTESWSSRAKEKLIPSRKALEDFSELILDEELASRVKNGASIYNVEPSMGKMEINLSCDVKRFKAIDPNGNLIAVMEKMEGECESGFWKTIRVFIR